MYRKLMHPADQLVMIMNRIYQFGMTTTSGGNLSILDENGDMWITPGGIDKGNLTRKDMVCVKKDGTLVGIHKPSSEYPFHLKVYERRSDIKAVLHAHPPALVAFSIVRRIPDTRLLANAYRACGQIAMAEYGLPGSSDLGEKIAKKFVEGANIAVLENHGVVIGSQCIFKAFKSFEALEFCARLEIAASILGNKRSLTQEQYEDNLKNQGNDLQEFTVESYSSHEKESRKKLCEIMQRAYRQTLINSSQGSFSVRLDDNNFVINPEYKDRIYCEPEDVVRIENGKKENGKTPSCYRALHEAIYKKHPEVNAVIIAHPTNSMAFAVTDVVLDSRTIPESYILMQDIKKLPFDSYYMQAEQIAQELGKGVPMVIVENDCIISTGSSLLNAFDRLEVAEYSAKAIIATKNLGNIVKINDQRIDEIRDAFDLN